MGRAGSTYRACPLVQPQGILGGQGLVCSINEFSCTIIAARYLKMVQIKWTRTLTHAARVAVGAEAMQRWASPLG